MGLAYLKAFDIPDAWVQVVEKIYNEGDTYEVEYGSENKFSTLFYGRLEKSTNKLLYCNAGHLPPKIFRNGEIIQLSTGGMVPGIFPDKEYDEDAIRLERGDLLVAYTDGFSEATNNNHEEFGDERLSHLFSEFSEPTLESLFTKVMSSVQNWASPLHQHDDMTIILVRIQ